MGPGRSGSMRGQVGTVRKRTLATVKKYRQILKTGEQERISRIIMSRIIYVMDGIALDRYYVCLSINSVEKEEKRKMG